MKKYRFKTKEEFIADGDWILQPNQCPGYPKGWNNIGEMNIYLGKEIDLDISEEKPEILVINDGEDSIDVNEFPYKVNAICLMNYNEELENLCVESGGKKVHVDEGNELTLYSSEGTTKLNG